MHQILAMTCGAALFFGCGSKDKDDHPRSGKPGAPSVKPAETEAHTPPARALPDKPLGFARPADLNYRFGKGAKSFKKVAKALKAKDWKAVQAACEAAIAADAGHVEARYMLAVALAQQGADPAIAENLSIALAADWLRWGPGLSSDERLTGFLATAEGAAVTAQSTTFRDAFLERAKAGTILVARRATFSLPKKPRSKPQWSAPRAELFSYDGTTKRYLRLTHTDESVAGWLMSPSGDEIAFIAYSHVQTPMSESEPPLIARVTIGVIDTETMLPVGKRARVKGTAREVTIEYGAGDELIVRRHPPDGRWTTGEPTSYVLDKAIGKLKKQDQLAGGGAVLHVSYEWVELSGAASPDVQADDEASTFRLLPTNTTVELPIGETVRKSGYIWAPDKAHLVVRTMARPCENRPEASLYLVDAATGKLKHVLRGRSSFGVRWLDNDRFMFEDDEGYVRIYDVARRTQVGHLKTRGGMSLRGVAATRGALCRSTPAPGGTDDGGDSGDVADPTDGP